MNKKLLKRLKSLIISSIIAIILVGTVIILKNAFLDQLRTQISREFDYTDLRLSTFPPALIIKDPRSKSLSPFLSAEKISATISFRSLLSRERPLRILIQNPVLRIQGADQEIPEEGKAKRNLAFPFEIERGLIRNGELYYWGKNESLQLKGVNAVFTQRDDRFSMKVEAGENVINFASSSSTFEGRSDFIIEGQGENITIKRIRMSGPLGVFRAAGELKNPFDPDFQIQGTFNIQAGYIVDLLDLPFEWAGRAEGDAIITRESGQITLESDFTSKDLFLNGVFMGRVDGSLDFKGNAGGDVEFSARKRAQPSEYIRIHFEGNQVRGIARGLHLDPIMKFINIPWPVKSPAWGEFNLDGGKLEADVEFRDPDLEAGGPRFPFQGKVKLFWDGEKKFSFSSDSLVSSFVLASVEGGMVVGETLDIMIRGEVKDVRQARAFTSLVLSRAFAFPEIRGRGETELRIFGDFNIPQVQATFSLRPGGFDQFDFDLVEGEAEIRNSDFFGTFLVTDPAMKGEANVTATPEIIRTEIKLDRGHVETILPAYGIVLPLEGEASGDFTFQQKDESMRFTGQFSSPHLEFSGRPLTQMRGKLDWTGDEFSFPELEFDLYEGHIKGTARLHLLDRLFDIDVEGSGIDLSSLFPPLEGNLVLNLEGKGVFGEDSAQGRFEIKNLYLDPFQRTDAEGKWELNSTEKMINLKLDGTFLPGDNDFHVSLDFPLDEKWISGDVRGSFTNFDILLPWGGAQGRIQYLAQITGTQASPQIKGAIDMKGPVFPFPQFAHALRDYSALVFVENGELSVRSIQGKIGGGDVQASGHLKLGKEGVEEIGLHAEGIDLLMAPLERTRALGSGSLDLIKDTGRFTLKGDFLIQRLSWQREITEKFAFSSALYPSPTKEPGFFDDMTLDLRIRAEDNAFMDNALGKVRGRFDLKVMGYMKSPIVLGDIEALGGELNFQDRKFKILRGRVSFFNPLVIEPYLTFTGETYVKDYRVTFSLDGLLDRLTPEFSSSPPLPPEDVLALLALGDAFKRTYSYDMSTQLSTASLLSFQISEEAKRRAEGLFSIDRFRIDPFIMESSAEMTARLTLGKKIAKDFVILYSTNLTSQREEIIRIEWELTRDWSIIGTRDEKGRLNIDVKIYRRF